MRALSTPKLYLRGDTWWCYWQNERWSTKTTDRRQAEQRVRDAYDPRHAAAQEKDLGHALLLLFEALDRRGRSAATKKQARQKVGHFVRLWGQHKPLRDIDWPLIGRYIDTRLKEDDVERLTVSHELGYLRQAWKLARAAGWAPRAWDELMPERFDRQYKPRERWLTADELRAVLASLPAEKAGYVAWIVATGSDIGDIARARAGDIDWKRGLVRVRGSKTVFRDRYVPITLLTRPLLRLASQHGPPFSEWPWIQGALRKLAVRLGIPHFSPKDLRRTHGQWLRNAGVEPHLIGRVLGHADSAMADRVYAQGDELAIARLVQTAVRCTNGVRMAPKEGGRRQATGTKTSRK